MAFKYLVVLFVLFGGLQGQRAGNDRNQTGMPRMGKFLATPLEKWLESCSKQSSINFVSSAFRDCVQRQGFPYDSTDLESRMDASFRSGGGADIDDVCQMIKALTDCSQEITNSLGLCLSSNVMKEVRTLFSSFHHSVCGGKMLLKNMYGSNPALQCYANYADSTFKCMGSKPELMDQWMTKITRASPTIYTPEYCKVQREFKKCTANLRGQCPQGTITAELFEAAVDSMNGDSPRCSNSAAAFNLNIVNIFVFVVVSFLLGKFNSK